MANPPFNVDGVNKEDLAKRTDRFPYGMPKNDNGNYIWIQMFLSSLAAPSSGLSGGRAGFVMANSASDARQSEMEIRRQMIQAGVVDVMVAVGSNMFYTVTLPVTLWFLDKSKQKTQRGDKILFIDARNIYTQIDRPHRDWIENHSGLIPPLARLYRGDDLNGFKLDESQFPNLTEAQLATLKSAIKNHKYEDIAGLCKLATLAEVEAQGWSLNPGRYVGVTEKTADDVDFAVRLEELNEELATLNTEARDLEDKIAENVSKLL
jgi:type I restriction enzyme M protein